MFPLFLSFKEAVLKRWCVVAKIDRRFLSFSHDIMMLFIALHFSMWLVLKEDLSLLDPNFLLKESLVFSLIISGLFLWFQIYKGVWRYFSVRQAALMMSVLGCASLIFFPLLTSVHMQPISIPSVVIFVNWGVVSMLMVGSRFLFKLFYQRWSASNQVIFMENPTARIILVGGGLSLKAFMKHMHRQKGQRYDILGYVTLEEQSRDRLEVIEHLGTLDALPDLIKNFNADGLHPHHIVLTDVAALGPPAQKLLKDLESFNIGLRTWHRGQSTVLPLTISDLFYQKTEGEFLEAFAGKNILLYGAACELGRELSTVFAKSRCAKIILWDQNTSMLRTFAQALASKKVMLFSKTTCEASQLTSFLQEYNVDIVINLKAFAALDMEDYDPLLSFEVYVEDNDRFARACQKAKTPQYYFITQEALHAPLAVQLAPLAGHVLHMTSQGEYGAINLPYVLSQQDSFFQGAAQHTLASEDLPVISPAYGAYMLGVRLSALITQTSWERDDHFQMDIKSYEELADMYSRLNPQSSRPHYHLQKATLKPFVWQHKQYKQIQSALKKMDYQDAMKALRAFYS